MKEINMNENKFKNKIEYYLNSDEYIDSAFTRMPSNAFINKAKCGIGGTTLELKDNRNSIIIVPNISVINSKIIDFPEAQGVYGKVTEQEVQLYLARKAKDKKYLKFLVTPESLKKLIIIVKSFGIDVYDEFFILFDEIHSAITEGVYRPKIAEAFDDFFCFKHKALISATPLKISNNRFYELDYHKINIDEKQRVIDIIGTNNVVKTLSGFLKSKATSDEKYHIFFNSVKQINDVVNLLGVNSVAILCNDCYTNRNNLLNNAKYIIDPIKGQNAKYNFYTTKYFEGWDLFDKNCNLIFASDVHNEHTCVDIISKVKQAFGRLRGNEAKRLIHVTNFNFQNNTLNFEEIEEKYISNYKSSIKTYNQALDEENLSLLKRVKDFILEIATINPDGYADYNSFKVDSNINHQKSINQYNNPDTVEQAWKEINFIPKFYYLKGSLTEKEKRIIDSGRISKNEKLKRITNKLKTLMPANGIINFDFLHLERENFKKDFGELYDFYNTLGYDKIKSLDFVYSEVKKEFLKHLEVTKIIRPIQVLLKKELIQGVFYPNEELVIKLEGYYREYGYNKKASASQLRGFINCVADRRSINNIDKRGYLIS